MSDLSIQDTYYCWNFLKVSKIVILVLTDHFLSKSIKKKCCWLTKLLPIAKK